MVTVKLTVRGDNSLGPIQRPRFSRLTDDVGVECPILSEDVDAESDVAITALLTFTRPVGATGPYNFTFGSGGYSTARLADAEKDADNDDGDVEMED